MLHGSGSNLKKEEERKQKQISKYSLCIFGASFES